MGDLIIQNNLLSLDLVISEGNQLDIVILPIPEFLLEINPNNPGPPGAAGATGADGAPGAQGPQGTQGSQGPQGSQGSASTAIGTPGSQGSQGSQGTGGGATGATGATGVTGPTGPQGSQGTQGSAGSSTLPITTVTGPSYTFQTADIGQVVSFTATGVITAHIPNPLGNSGDQIVVRLASSTGVITIDGATGTILNSANLTLNSQWSEVILVQETATNTWWIPSSPKGATGATGPQGSQGSQSTGGVPGTQGTQGSLGPTGATGATGAQGAQGTQGTAGSRGSQGSQGSQSTALGTPGSQGTQGTQGSLGPTGATGATGAQGPQGSQGSQGSQSTAGVQGTQGTQGSAGSSGLPIVTVTGPSYTFQSTDIGQVVSFTATGVITAHIPNPLGNAADQIIVRLASSTGIVTIDGATGTTINANAQTLSTQWSEFVLVQETATNTWWVASTPKGSTGATGVTGPTGPQGTQGSIGVQGTQGTQGSLGPTGAQGTQGTQGSIGLQGSQGTQGSQSTAAGLLGSQGTQGTQGSLGPTGATGAQGSQGTQGSQSTAPAPTGATGATGPQGTQGTQGSIGLQGTQGTQGSAGSSTLPITTVTGPSYTFQTADIGQVVSFTATGVITAHIPNPLGNSGDQIVARLASTSGVVTIDGATGVTLNSANLTLNAQWSEVVLLQETATNTWWVPSSPKGATGATGVQGTQGTIGVQGTQGTQGSQGSVGTNFLTTPSVAATASTNTPSPNALTDNVYKLTAQATAANFKITGGTANDGQYLDIYIVATAATQTISWQDATFGYTAFYVNAATSGTNGGSGGLLPYVLPLQIKKGQRMILQFQYDTANSLNRWVLLNRMIG